MSKLKQKILIAFMALALVSAVPISASAVEAGTTATSSQTSEVSQSETASQAEPEKPESSNSSESSENSNALENSNLDYLFSENTSGNANLIASQEVIADNGKFQFIAVTTRDKDVFYVIIDRMKAEDNVYFLNEVDTYDLQKLMSKNSDGSSADEEAPETSDSEETAEESDKDKADDEAQSDDGGMNNILLIGGVVVLAVIGFVIFKIKKGGFGKKNQATIPLDDFEEEDDEEINEDEEKKQ